MALCEVDVSYQQLEAMGCRNTQHDGALGAVRHGMVI